MGSLSDTSGKNVKPPAYMIESDLSPLNKIYKVLSIAEKTLEPYEEPFNMVEINIRGTAHNSEDLPSKLDILIARICGCKNYVQDTKDGILNTRFNYETINDIKNKIIPKFNNIEDFRIFVGYNYCRFCWNKACIGREYAHSLPIQNKFAPKILKTYLCELFEIM